MKTKIPNPKSFGLTKTGTQTYSPPFFGRKIRMIGMTYWLTKCYAWWIGRVTLKNNVILTLLVEEYRDCVSPCVWKMRLDTAEGFHKEYVHHFKARPSKATIEQVLRKFEKDAKLAAQALTAITETI